MRQTLDGSGAVLAATGYSPWGTPQQPLTTPFGFTGELQQQDRVQLRARWYDPGNGTFTSRDPWEGWSEQPQSLHAYAYVANNPINFTDPSGLFRCRNAAAVTQADLLGPIGMRQGAERSGVITNQHYYDYDRFCQGAYRRADALFQMHRQDVVTAMAELFAATDLPGGSRGEAARLRQSDLTAAAERLEFMLDWMADIAGTTFKHETGQLGINEQFLDPWPAESGNQMNHFMQAVGLAYAPDAYVNHWTVQGFVRPDAGENSIDTALRLIVGHEKIGDAGEASVPGRKQVSTAAIIPAQYRAATLQDVELFLDAVQADALGDTLLRDCLLRDIIPGLPDDLRGQTDRYPNRVGNSLQDLRLSVKGWAFGQQIEAGDITTLPEASDWLTTHLR